MEHYESCDMDPVMKAKLAREDCMVCKTIDEGNSKP